MMPRGFQNNKDGKSISPNKSTALNPNAAEFVPLNPNAAEFVPSYKLVAGNSKNVGTSKPDIPIAAGKAILDRSGSSASNNSDDEAHKYWRHQLPDDITPDFKTMGGNELQTVGDLSLSGLSIHDGIDAPQFGPLGSSQFSSKRQSLPVHGNDDISLFNDMGYAGAGYVGAHSFGAFSNLASNSWNKQLGSVDQFNGRDDIPYIGESNTNFRSEFGANDHVGLGNTSISALEFLALQFPGLATTSLAEVYYTNECDLDLTIEMLTQLENMNSKTSSTPSLTPLDFPALPISDVQSGLVNYSKEEVQQAPTSYHPADKRAFPFIKHSPVASRGAPDFASAVRRLASDSGHWKYEGNGSPVASVTPSRTSQIVSSSYNGHGKSFSDKMLNTGTARASPIWLETGDAVGNMYSESREEARDLACLRNVYFEQAIEAYRAGNKALVRELSEKGQSYNVHMKAAHEKARENIYRQRNPLAPSAQGYSRGQEPSIDLLGLHVSEAIHVLKHELTILKRTARSAGQRLQVMIYVGTGHHIEGSRNPARLPVSVEQYLQDEGLQFTEPQPGMLRVVLC